MPVSPLADKLVTLFGGSGFLGHYVAQVLLRRGARLRIASREPEKAYSLKPLANLGQLQFARCDILDERSVRRCVAASEGVVNLVGAFEGDLEKLMGDAAGDLARAALEAGANRFVHVSAIGADAGSAVSYARGKALGEEKVLQAFPQATVLRPSIIFAEDDDFLNMFARLIRLFPILPVFGPDARLQLTFADDVADAVVNALEDSARHGGRIYELGGPEVLTMMDINERIAAAQNRRRTFLPMPDGVSSTFAAMPGTPMSKDQWMLLKQGSVANPALPGYAELGITPRPVSLFLDRWMQRYRRHGRFGNTRGSL
jgi:NADH dehydrogenase